MFHSPFFWWKRKNKENFQNITNYIRINLTQLICDNDLIMLTVSLRKHRILSKHHEPLSFELFFFVIKFFNGKISSYRCFHAHTSRNLWVFRLEVFYFHNIVSQTKTIKKKFRLMGSGWDWKFNFFGKNIQRKFAITCFNAGHENLNKNKKFPL